MLREMIVSREFSSGNAWSLRKLAVRLKMSVVPIAEGLRRLEQEGILEVRPQRGISVRQLSARQLEELKLIREGFEVQAARLVALYHPKEPIKKMMNLARKLQKTLRAKKYAQAALIDMQLHQTLIETANCPLLTERYRQLVTLSMLSTDELGPDWLRMEMSESANHVGLVEAIAEGDPDRADQAIREHINTGADRKAVRNDQ